MLQSKVVVYYFNFKKNYCTAHSIYDSKYPLSMLHVFACFVFNFIDRTSKGIRMQYSENKTSRLLKYRHARNYMN